MLMIYFASMATTFSIFWLGWLVLFCVIETAALIRERGKKITNYNGGTLSELVWRLTRTNRLVMGIFLAFWVVLTYHFFIQH